MSNMNLYIQNFLVTCNFEMIGFVMLLQVRLNVKKALHASDVKIYMCPDEFLCELNSELCHLSSGKLNVL